jgi:hypothetical protein
MQQKILNNESTAFRENCHLKASKKSQQSWCCTTTLEMHTMIHEVQIKKSQTHQENYKNTKHNHRQKRKIKKKTHQQWGGNCKAPTLGWTQIIAQFGQLQEIRRNWKRKNPVRSFRQLEAQRDVSLIWRLSFPDSSSSCEMRWFNANTCKTQKAVMACWGR